MQRLKTGPLIDAAKNGEIWLDGGHNPAAGLALAEAMDRLQPRATYLICGMLNTKDIGGYLRPLARHTEQLIAVSIPGEAATLSAEDTAKTAQDVGMQTTQSDSVLDAVQSIVATDPDARILICGSLYLAGAVLRENS
jgi:dihydrofolate synthase/folylpolyglutamate synthase